MPSTVIDVFDSATSERRRLEAERDAYRAALLLISKCNEGQGLMPELAKRVLDAHKKGPLT